MSTALQRLPLHEAQRIAADVVEQLAPHCTRIEIAGSIRRECETVGDIEIVCIPKVEEVPDGLFETKIVRRIEFITRVQEWERVKGYPTGKYTQRVLPGGMKLDLFMATLENWGLIYAIRTGSARFSRYVLAGGWVKAGFRSENGRLCRERTVSMPEVRTERALFDLIGLEYVEPPNRA